MAITKVTRNMLTTGIVDNSNATAITIDSSENVTLSGDLTIAKATSGADSTFKVASTAASGENDATVIINSGGTGDAMLRFDYESSTDRARIGVTTSAQALQFFTAGANERMRITSAGLIGMGDSPNNLTSEIVTITTPASGGGQGIAFKRLDTNTDQVCGQIRWSNNATDDLAFIKVKTDGANASSAMQFFTNTGSGIGERMRITSAGNVGIGTASPNSAIHTHIASSGGTYHQFTNSSTGNSSNEGWKIGIHDDENFIIWGQESSESFRVYNNGAYRFTIDHNGAVSVAGSFSKGSGSFKIDHPLPAKKDTHHLVHSFVEAPQADNIYRGTVTLSGGTATINLDTVSGMTEGTYVLLNTNTSCFTSNETDWDAVKGSVSGNILTINCQNSSSTATVSWLVIGERHDQHMKDTEWTDDNGKVIVEPLKEEG